MEHVIDATNKPLGRLASEIAIVLQGKKNPNYEPRLIGDDKVLVKNVDKLTVSGKKEDQKVYHRHTGYMGHLKDETLREVITKKGKGEALKRAVKQMLPKNKLQNERMKRLAIER